MRLRPVLHATGLMMAALGATMAPAALVDFLDGAPQWRLFALLACLTITIGGVTSLASYLRDARVRVNEGFVLTVVIWSTLAVVAAGPFLLHGLSGTDALFESMSGLTTTGATVMTGLDHAPRGILLWRALLQWIGGIGIIVTAIAILPMLRVGGMQIFQMESSDASGKFLPRVSEIAAQTTIVYALLTVICATLYGNTGMSGFDALAHAFTTVSAGGFSTSDGSMRTFAHGGADLVAIVFMCLAALPFGLMALALRGTPGPLFSDPQPRTFFMIALGASIAIGLWLLLRNAADAQHFAIWRIAAFNTVSILTGTGYATADFSQWGGFSDAIFFLLMFCGGCAGSAACGMKIFRVHIGLLTIQAHARSLLLPGRIVPVRYGSKILHSQTLHSILFFIILYLCTFALLAAALALTGLEPRTALSAAAACLSNVGPGLGDMIGPAGSYQMLPATAKWLCIFAMLLGRLELITALLVISPRFWRL